MKVKNESLNYVSCYPGLEVASSASGCDFTEPESARPDASKVDDLPRKSKDHTDWSKATLPTFDEIGSENYLEENQETNTNKTSSQKMLSEEAINELLAVYYDAALTGTLQHEDAQKQLIDLATNIIYSSARKKIKPQDIEEYRSEAKLQAYESLLEYDPAKGSFTSFIALRNNWFSKEANIEKVTQLTQIGGPQRRVLNAYKAASAQKYDNVTIEDVLEQTIRYNMDKDPTLTREECIQKIKKTGEYKIITKDLNHIIQLADPSFDLVIHNENSDYENPKTPVSDNITETLEKDPLEGALEKILTMLGDETKQAIVAGYHGVLGKVLGTYFLAEEDTKDVDLNASLGYTNLSKIAQTDKEEVKQIVKTYSNKIKTPHAHWVYLTEGSGIVKEIETDYKTRLQTITPILN